MEVSHLLILLLSATGVLIVHKFINTKTVVQHVFSDTHSGHSTPDFSEDLQSVILTHYPKFKYCAICKDLVDLVNSCVTTNSTFNTFRKPAETLCLRLVKIAGVSSIVCPGIIFAYGPPVLYVADQLILDPESVCINLGVCLPTLSADLRQQIPDYFQFRERHRLTPSVTDSRQKDSRQHDLSQHAFRQHDSKHPDSIQHDDFREHDSKLHNSKQHTLRQNDLASSLTNDNTPERSSILNSIPQFLPQSKQSKSEHFGPKPYLLDLIKQVMGTNNDIQEMTIDYQTDLIDKDFKVKAKKPLKILQLSDIHVDNEYKEGAVTSCDVVLCCHSLDNGTGKAGHYGDYNCDIPWWTVDVLVDSIKQMEDQPDFIIYTGDSPPHDVWKESWETQYSADRDVVEFLRDRFDGISIYPTLGNHETYPANLYFSPLPDYQYFNEKNLEMWTDLFTIPNDQRRNIQEDAYYEVLVKPGLRLLSFNTNHGYTFNFYALLNFKNPNRDKQRIFMEKTLSDAKLNDEKVIIIGHIPPGDIPNTFQPYGAFYSNLVTKYSDIIVLQLFGHTHRDQYELIIPNHEVKEASGVVFIAPSISTYPNQNPAYRVYDLDPDTFQPLDYHQYYLNITKANEQNEAVVEKMYSAKSEYNLHDLSAQSFLELSQKFSTNRTLFDIYWRNRHARSDVRDYCNDACRHITICETLSSTFRDWVTCVRNIGF